MRVRNAASVLPDPVGAAISVWRRSRIGNFKRALELQDKLMPLHDALFVESNPGPVKYAAEKLGLCSGETRLPLAPLAASSKAKVDTALAKVGLFLV